MKMKTTNSEESHLKEEPNAERKSILSKENEGVEAAKVKDKIKGVLLGITMITLVGISSTCVALLQRKIPDFELNSIRSGISLTLITIGLLVTKQLPRIPKSEILGVCLFSVNATICPLAGFVSVSLIPMSYFKSLLFTFTIVTGLLLFPKCLGEKTDLKSIVFAALCMTGVILSIQPELIFNWKKKEETKIHDNSTIISIEDSTTKYTTERISEFPLKTTVGCVAAAITGLGDCFHIIITKRNPYLQENVLKVLFWNITFSLTLSLVVMSIFEKPLLPESLEATFLVIQHSVSFVFSWGCAVLSLRYISGNTYNIIYSSLVVLMLIPQYTLLKRILPGNHNWIEVLGTVFVFIGATAGSIIYILESR